MCVYARRLSIDDIERHPWMVKEAHAPMHGADSVLEEGGTYI